MIWIYIPIMRGSYFIKEGLVPLLDTPIKRGIGGKAPKTTIGWESEKKKAI